MPSPSLSSSVNKGRSGGSHRSSPKGSPKGPPPPEMEDDDDSMMAEARAVISEFDEQKSAIPQQQAKPKQQSRPNHQSPRASPSSSRRSLGKPSPPSPNQKKSSPPKQEFGNSGGGAGSRRSIGTAASSKKQPSTRGTGGPPTKQKVKNRVVVDTSGSASIRRAAEASSAAASSPTSPKSGRTDRAVVDQRDMKRRSELSVDHSVSTAAATQKRSSPRRSPGGSKKMEQRPQPQPQPQPNQRQQQSRKLNGSPAKRSSGKLGPALDAMAQRERKGNDATHASSKSNRATAANLADASVKSGMSGATDVFMSNFVSDPTGDDTDAVSKRSLKSNAPSVSASVMLNAIDPSRAVSPDGGDDATAWDDGTLTTDGTFAGDDSSTVLGGGGGAHEAKSTVGELVQVSSSGSTSFGVPTTNSRRNRDVSVLAATSKQKSAHSITSSIKTRKTKNKHNVTVIGAPTPPLSDTSAAALSARTEDALNGDAVSSSNFTEASGKGQLAEANGSGQVSSLSPSKQMLAPVASRESDSTSVSEGRDGDPSLGTVSAATAATAASASARSVQSAHSTRSARTTQSRVPDIDLNAEEGSLSTNMTGATVLNQRLKASIEQGKSSKMENIIEVLGENDPLSRALREAEGRGDGEVGVTKCAAAAEAGAAAEEQAHTSKRSIKSMLSRKSNNGGSASHKKEKTEQSTAAPAVGSRNSISSSSRSLEQEKAAAVVGAIASSVGGLDVSTDHFRTAAESTGSDANVDANPGSSRKIVMRRGLKQGNPEEEGYFPTSKSNVVRGSGNVETSSASGYEFRNEEQNNNADGNNAAADRALEEGDKLKPIDHEHKPTWEDEESFFKRNRKSLLVGFGFLAVIGAIVGISVAASAKKKPRDGTAASTTGADFFQGTPAPTPFLTLDSMLSTWSPDGGLAMQTLPLSPQGRAYAWIKTDIELLGYNPDDLSGYDDSVVAYQPRRMADRVRTRYALSVLNYTFWGGGTTGGVATDASDLWSQDNDECDWARVSCEDDTVGQSDGIVKIVNLEEAEIPEGSVLPGEISMLHSLRVLILTTTRVGGSIPDVFGPMRELRQLDLDDCVFTGNVPSSIGTLNNLKELRLNDNILDGPLPDFFRNLKNLRVLELQKNLFTGTISESIWSLENIADLRVGDNELQGSLSTQIGNLQKLERFWAYTNQLTGRIPTQFGQLSFLRDLSMDDNRLVGAIPKQLASLPLEELWLNNNKLSSSIPSEMGEMFGLENLYLDENILTGFVSTVAVICKSMYIHSYLIY